MANTLTHHSARAFRTHVLGMSEKVPEGQIVFAFGQRPVTKTHHFMVDGDVTAHRYGRDATGSAGEALASEYALARARNRIEQKV